MFTTCFKRLQGMLSLGSVNLVYVKKFKEVTKACKLAILERFRLLEQEFIILASFPACKSGRLVPSPGKNKRKIVLKQGHWFQMLIKIFLKSTVLPQNVKTFFLVECQRTKFFITTLKNFSLVKLDGLKVSQSDCLRAGFKNLFLFSLN